MKSLIAGLLMSASFALLDTTLAQDKFVASRLGVDELVAQWEQQNNTVVTADVRAELAEKLAAGFSTKMMTLGFQTNDVLKLKEAIAENGGLKVTADGPWGSLDNPVYGGAHVKIESSFQKTAVFSFFDFKILVPWLVEYPSVKIVVVPVPPTDYRVEINGHTYPVAERYKVPPGSLTISVTRESKPPCQWTGEVTDGDNHLVNCNL